jgi:hypothetical protein
MPYEVLHLEQKLFSAPEQKWMAWPNDFSESATHIINMVTKRRVPNHKLYSTGSEAEVQRQSGDYPKYFISDRKGEVNSWIADWQEACLSSIQYWELKFELKSIKDELERVQARLGRLEYLTHKAQSKVDGLLTIASNIQWILATAGGPIGKGINVGVEAIKEGRKFLGVLFDQDEQGRIVNVEGFLKSDGPTQMMTNLREKVKGWLKDRTAELSNEGSAVVEALASKTTNLSENEFRGQMYQRLFPELHKMSKQKKMASKAVNIPLMVREANNRRLEKVLKSIVSASREKIVKTKALYYPRFYIILDSEKHKKIEKELKALMPEIAKAEAAREFMNLLKGIPEEGGGAESSKFKKLQEALEHDSFKVRLSGVHWMSYAAKNAILKPSVVITELIRKLGDGNYIVRAMAARELGALKAVMAMGALYEAMAKEEEEFAKYAMADSLKKLGAEILYRRYRA